MPVAMPRGDRGNQHWTPRANLDSFTTPFPLYSGYLMKLGSNDRWQSRLFTFDGSVLTCVGKRRRTPPIATYDPHVSSPFVSAPSRTQPYNPNTKWFLHISSITDIRLLPSSKSYYRCFPTSDLPRGLFIQTSDGRSVTLKAKKNIELEGWFFVLTKMWAFQQLLQRTEEDLAATATATVTTAAAAVANAVNASAAAATASAHVSSGTNVGECTVRRESGGGGGAAAAGGAGGEADPYHQLILTNNHAQKRNSNNNNNNNHLQQHQQYQNNNYHHHSSFSPLPPSSSRPATAAGAAAPPCTSHLPAHQQSSHLFNNYLQRQMYQQQQQQQQQDQGDDYQSLHARHYQQYQQQQQAQPHSQHHKNKSWNSPMRPQHRQTAPPVVTTIVQESLMRYQIPLPRVSAFLPGGLDWPEQQHQQQLQQQYGEKEVTDEQGVTTTAAANGGAVVVSIVEEEEEEEEDEKAQLRESGVNIRNAYLRKNSLADQFSSPPVPSTNINNRSAKTTMSGGAGGGRGSAVSCDRERMITDGSSERQGGRGGSWTQDPSCSIPTTEDVHTGSSTPGGLGIQQQQQTTILWPAAGTMEPAKVAAIDMWRRSLMSPLARANTANSFHSDDPDNQALVPASAAKLFLSRNNSRRPSVSADNDLLLGPGLPYCCEADADEEDEEDYGNDHFEHQGRPKYFSQQQHQLLEPYQQPRMAIDAASETDDVPLAVVRTIRQNSIGGAMQLPMEIQQTMGLKMPVENRPYTHDEENENEDDDDEDETGAHDHFANKYHNVFVRPRRRRRFHNRHHQDKVPEPALLHAQRHSRWQKTQLSSEDESGTNRDSFAALTNTPDMSGNSYSTFLATNYNNNRDRDSYLNNLNSCAGRDRDSYPINGGYEANKEALSDPTLNQHHLRSSAEPNLPRSPNTFFMNSAEYASANGLPATRQSIAVVQSKPSVPTVGILKRPSLPGMDTAALLAAVKASKAMQHHERTTSFQSFTSPLERDMTYNNLSNLASNNSNVPVHPFAHLPTPLSPSTSTHTGTPFRAPASGFLPPPPARPPRRHPLRTPVASDIKFSPSRRNSLDGSIISGFGGGSLINGLGGGDITNNINGGNIPSGKVEKSRSLLSFLALNKTTSSSSTTAAAPSNDFSSPPAHNVPFRRNSLPSVHFLGLNLNMGATPSSTSSTPIPEVKKQRRSSILGLGRLDRSEKHETKEREAAAAAAEALAIFQAEVLLIRDPSPPQTPSPAIVTITASSPISNKSPNSSRRFSLPAAVHSSATPPSTSNSPPSLLSSFPPTATRSTSGSSRPSSRHSSRPTSGYITNLHNSSLLSLNSFNSNGGKRLSSGSLSRPRSRANSNNLAGSSGDHSQYTNHQLQQSYQLKLQAPLIQVNAPAPTPVSEKEKGKEKEKEREHQQHKGYCRGKNLEVDSCNGSISGGNGYKGRPLTCCSESELIEVLNGNSEEDDDFCYF